MKHLILGLWIIVLLWNLNAETWAAETCQPWLIQIVSVEGNVEARRAGQKQWTPVQRGEVFCPGDSLRVGTRSRANIFLHHEETTLSLDQGTTLIFSELEDQPTSWLDMLKGIIYFISRTPRTLKVKTPYVNAAVEGTEFLLRIESGQTFVWVFEGRILASNTAGSLMLISHQGALARVGEAPQPRLVINPRDAVQWALYYPPVIDDRTAEQSARAIKGIQEALQRYRQGNLTDAIEHLQSVPGSQRDARYYTLKAALLLSVGRVDEARPAIRQALTLNSRYGDAVALKAIIVLVQNNKEQALNLARQAIEFSPNSSVPYIALSYVQQATFDLDKALASARRATRLSPGDALAWTRVAELRLAAGDLAGALKAAQRSVALNPQLARTQTVLGYAYLTRIEIKSAKAAFEQAIRLDSADPLPHLGLGLAMIRQGELEQGRRLIEMATSLDPNNSLIRSYLGKAYYEERRDSLAGTQLAIGKELDPQDPTPWYYDAIRKQTENRPIEALQDLQKSIDLNNGRAVYRSRLMLDEDQASRGASLGRIYNDLGFQQRALVQGWQSSITDPGNFSAHRLLADSYSSLPRHEIARVSELLQSQLLQPLNLTPIQPQLAESNLGIISGNGPSDLGLNEYNALFIQEGWRLQADGVVAGNQTWGNDLVFSGIKGKVAYSLGQFHYETDGFRPNNDQRIDVYNAFVQTSPTYNTSIQAEFRAADIDQGDLTRQLSGAFDPTERDQIETRVGRLGFRYKSSPKSDLLASLTYEKRKFFSKSGNFDPPLEFILNAEREGYNLEVQELFRSKRVDIIAGGSYIEQDITDDIVVRSLDFSSSSLQQNENRHGIVYGYPYIKLRPELTVILGASGDFLHGLLRHKDQFNPKLGLIWKPRPDTLFRAAAFRALARTFIATQQTLEPTHVAGFNQFYNDSEATDIWRYGLAVDKQVSPALYVGLEFSQRDLTLPVFSIAAPDLPPQLTSAEREEQLGRVYAYWLAAPKWAFSSEYIFERFQRDRNFPTSNGFLDLKNHHLRLGARYFSPSGFHARLTAHYVDQQKEAFDNSEIGNDFWIIDTSIGYRLPKRYGQISLQVQNLFDNHFNYQVTDEATPLFYPERLWLLKCTLAF